VTAKPAIADDAEILLYVHGMDSRTEEADDMAKALMELGKARGKNFVMIAMDLPTSGYADKVDHRRISDIHVLGNKRDFPPEDFDAHGQHNAPLLDFDENFIVSFVDTLDRQTPIKDKIRAIIGGSLGGNMALRLGRRTDLPWLKAVVPWSPGSIWDSLADGDDLFKHAAVRTGWERAGGDPNSFNDRKGIESSSFRRPSMQQSTLPLLTSSPRSLICGIGAIGPAFRQPWLEIGSSVRRSTIRRFACGIGDSAQSN
jgi:hypothetical protein